MPSFEIPTITVCPDATARPVDVVSIADFLLCALFVEDTVELWSEPHENDFRFIRRSRGESSGLPLVVAALPSRVFRPLLARFGHHFLSGQPYGGYAEIDLSQGEKRRCCAIYLGNDAWRGHWLRVYSRQR